ncbi:hypothetical protein LUZ60_015721 [Juncus effusus]|nr:hypothetical protein LUZ60_015721 [Juncus effusus]
MGKKMKPKARNPRKPQSRSKASDPNPNPNSPPDSEPQQEESETQQQNSCTHYTKSDSHLNKILLSILTSTDNSSCEHCRDESPSTNTKKGKKNSKKGGSKPESKSKPDPIWVCLDCGRSFCGGAVSEAVPYGHSRRHAKQDRHSWAVGTNSAGGTAWCFICDCEVPIEMPNLEETSTASSAKPNSEPNYTLSKSESKPEPNFQIGNHHVIRGLSNLGNTCFFNSVLQNILALKTLRESLFPSPQNPNSDPTNPNSPTRVSVTGPLTSSLKKLFIETSLSDEYKGTLSPKNLFSNICAKAPQFRGFQQQDSHELLRYLLDGLHTEEISARKSKQEESSSDSVPVPVKPVPTLVDSVFGGLLSSTVSCMDCGFTSVVHEPFLDLSLPVPAKKNNNNNNNNNNINRKGGVNRPTVVRGRGGRAQRLKQRTRSSPVEEDKEKLDASSSKEIEGSTVSKEEGGADLKAEVEVGPAASLVSEEDEVSFSWMDFIEPGPAGDCSEGGLEEGAVSEVARDVESDGADAREKVGDDDTDGAVLKAAGNRDIISSDAKSEEEKDSADLKASGNKSISSDVKSEEEQDSTVLGADAGEITDGAVLKESGDQVVSSDAKSEEEKDSTVLKATRDETVNSSNAKSEEETDGTVLKADMRPEPDSTIIDAKFEGSADVSSRASPNESSGSTALDAKADDVTSTSVEPDQSDSTVLKATTKEPESETMAVETSPKDSENTILDANAKEPESTVFEAHPKESENESMVLDANTKETGNEITVFDDDESWLLDDNNNGSDPKPTSKPDPSTEDSATIATDMGFSTLIGPSPNPNPNPNPDPNPDPNPVSREEDETDFTGFGDMFNEPEQDEVSSRPVKKQPAEEDENDDSIFWGLGSFTGFGFSNQEVDNDTDNPVSVASCLGLFTKPEMLTGEHAWHCEKCSSKEEELRSGAIEGIAGEGKKEKVRRDAVKRFLVDKAPRVLTVHLKRFGQDLRGRLSKLRGFVEFEEVLDVKPYFDPRSKEKERFTYRLVGVVEHSGSMSGGHYIAYVRGERKSKDGAHSQTWFYASDAHVKEVSLQQVLKSEAYLLFYERIED